MVFQTLTHCCVMLATRHVREIRTIIGFITGSFYRSVELNLKNQSESAIPRSNDRQFVLIVDQRRIWPIRDVYAHRRQIYISAGVSRCEFLWIPSRQHNLHWVTHTIMADPPNYIIILSRFLIHDSGNLYWPSINSLFCWWLLWDFNGSILQL